MNHRIQTVARPGLTLWTRPALLDETVIDEVITRDTYRLGDTDLHGATVVDCGAHIGVFSTACAQAGAVRVISIEPQPENLELLRLNAANWPQIEIRPVALGATRGTAAIAGESGGSHHEPGHPDAIPVERVTLAEILDQLPPVAVLKLDMEGSEIDTLLACSHDQLARCTRIVLETHGPAVCPWIERPYAGDLIEHLLPTHNIAASGFPTRLGLILATRNGCARGW